MLNIKVSKNGKPEDCSILAYRDTIQEAYQYIREAEQNGKFDWIIFKAYNSPISDYGIAINNNYLCRSIITS